MSKPFSFGNIDIGLTTGSTDPAPRARTGRTFRIAVLGDFSGRSNRGICETGSSIAQRKVMQIDRDNFDAVLVRLKVEVAIPVAGGASIALQFHEVDDFDPDRVFDQSELFQRLKRTRRRLNNPSTFEEAAEEVRSWGQQAPEPSGATESEPATEATEVGADLIADILAQEESKPKPAMGNVDWNSVIREIVSPFVDRTAQPDQSDLVAKVDEATSREMAKVFHHPEFQAIEAGWRGLFFLTRRLETDNNLVVSLIDVSKEELVADLNASDELNSSGLYKLLVEQSVGTQGGKPWSVLIGNYTFDDTDADAQLLGRLAKIAHGAGAPFIASADAHLAGADSFGGSPDPDDWSHESDSDAMTAWNALRRLPDAAYVGLALPRFLLRLPYGKKTNPTEHFDFDEFPDGVNHQAYLWGNPAFAAAFLLGQSFTEHGWSFRPGMLNEIGGLPVHVYDDQGDPVAHPCAEAQLTERAAKRFAERGLMPVMSVLGKDAIRVTSFRSIAIPEQPLIGHWQTG